MKTLLLVRHAKSDWNDPSLPDFERPLNQRGKTDAPAMAKRLLDKSITIDRFIASPAKRAAKTAKKFAKVYGQKESDIIFRESLYHAETPAFLEAIAAAPNDANSIAIFSHNFGITDFANSLTYHKVDNIPTCGVFAVKADCENWKDFWSATKEFYFFDYPKSETAS